MNICVFGNSLSHGIEINASATSLLELKEFYSAQPNPHPQAWPSELNLKENTVLNLSLPSCGFWGNVSRAINYKITNPEDGFFLIDASLHQHLFSEIHGKPKAPVFFSEGSIQKNYQKSLNEETVQFQIWNAAQILTECKIHFLFYFSYNPFWFGSNKDESHLSFDFLYSEYAQSFYENRNIPNGVLLNEQISKYFLSETPLISILNSDEITMFAHPKGPAAHQKIAQHVKNLLIAKGVVSASTEKTVTT